MKYFIFIIFERDFRFSSSSWFTRTRKYLNSFRMSSQITSHLSYFYLKISFNTRQEHSRGFNFQRQNQILVEGTNEKNFTVFTVWLQLDEWESFVAQASLSNIFQHFLAFSLVHGATRFMLRQLSQHKLLIRRFSLDVWQAWNNFTNSAEEKQ